MTVARPDQAHPVMEISALDVDAEFDHITDARATIADRRST
jgi:hypothetical protein